MFACSRGRAVRELSVLDLTGQGIKCLVRHVLAVHSEHHVALLRELYCTGNELQRLDAVVCRSLRSIEVLCLSANQLRSLPSEIGLLGTICELRLESNCLSALPWQIGELASLESLWLGCNELTALPVSIDGLRRLRDLWLCSNAIEALPESIGDLHRLERLELSSNQLSDLPHSVSRLARLKELHLRSNLFSVLPQCLMPGPPSLVLLDLSHNLLHHVPPAVASSLRHLRASGGRAEAMGVRRTDGR